MNHSNSKISALRDLLIFHARQMLAAEIQLKNTIPQWIDKTGSVKIKMILQKYQGSVQLQISKLIDFLESEKIDPANSHNLIMDTMIYESTQQLEKCIDSEVRNACMLVCIQNINHYKICVYGTMASFAKALGIPDAEAPFCEAKIGERKTDDRITQLANQEINFNARIPAFLPA